MKAQISRLATRMIVKDWYKGEGLRVGNNSLLDDTFISMMNGQDPFEFGHNLRIVYDRTENAFYVTDEE